MKAGRGGGGLGPHRQHRLTAGLAAITASRRQRQAGLVGLTRVVALDMQRKVTCNAIAPFAAARVTESIKPANSAQAAYKERALKVPAAPSPNKSPSCRAEAAATDSSRRARLGGLLFSQPRPVIASHQPGEAGLAAAIAEAWRRTAARPPTSRNSPPIHV
jgi:hypothetical protein